MGWEERNGCTYYYQKSRDSDGRVRSRYVGTGQIALFVAYSDQLDKAKATQLRRQQRNERKKDEEQDRAVAEFSRSAKALRDSCLVLAGFHTHKGQWRKKREDGMAVLKLDKQFEDNEASEEFLEFVKLVERTNKENPRKADLVALRGALDANPGFWVSIANLSTVVENNLICNAGYAVPMQEALKAGMRDLRKDLGAKDASQLELMLIREVALSWLDYHTVQLTYQGVTKGSHSTSAGLYWDKRVDAAQRRYTRAMESLARVRRLLKSSSVQINIAEQQVNVTR